ncbi:MAG: winged helix-turn-helix domain-containing protein [Methanotrichaceae archaeon]
MVCKIHDSNLTKVLSASIKHINYKLFFNGGIKIQRRTKLDIITCILKICKAKGSSKTRIVYQANLNFKNAGLYLDWLIKHGFLDSDNKIYKTTPMGLDLLANLTDIASMTSVDIDSDLPFDSE